MKLNLSEMAFVKHYRIQSGWTSGGSGDIYVNPTKSEFDEVAGHRSNAGNYRQAVGFIFAGGKLYIFPYNVDHSAIARQIQLKNRFGKPYETYELNSKIPHGTIERTKDSFLDKNNEDWTEWKIEKLQGPRPSITRTLLKPMLARINGKEGAAGKFISAVKNQLKYRKNIAASKAAPTGRAAYAHLFATAPVKKKPVAKKKLVTLKTKKPVLTANQKAYRAKALAKLKKTKIGKK